MPIISFSCLIVLTRTTMLNRSDKCRHYCYVLDLGRKVFGISPLNKTLAVGLGVDALCQIKQVPFLYQFAESFKNHGWVLNHVKCFAFIVLEDHMVFLLHSINTVDYVNFSSNIKPTIHSCDKPYLVIMNNVLFIYHWNIYANVLLRIFQCL